LLYRVAKERAVTTAQVPAARDYQWPEAGGTWVPFWVSSDPQVYEQEIRLIFCGERWADVGLEIEIPQPGDCKQATIDDRPEDCRLHGACLLASVHEFPGDATAVMQTLWPHLIIQQLPRQFGAGEDIVFTSARALITAYRFPPCSTTLLLVIDDQRR